ncbi:hypothetical protein GCM10023186_02980 [Hymenobacter koreensis]|uniref:Uncharacterized protein n=1 Tax=Hymenobacter koreensis TaxID=1084523 RepID=A0ABP8ITW9_9BACT
MRAYKSQTALFLVNGSFAYLCPDAEIISKSTAFSPAVGLAAVTRARVVVDAGWVQKWAEAELPQWPVLFGP